MKLTANFQVPRVDMAKFRQALHEQLGEVLARAAVAWIHVAATETIPVWSGASRGTFSPLAAHVGYVLSLSPVAGAPDRVALGQGLGEATFDLGSADPGKYTFSYATTLPWLIVNEYYNANSFINPKTGMPYFHLKNPGPYHFQEKAEAAFRREAKEARLPGWVSIITVTHLSV